MRKQTSERKPPAPSAPRMAQPEAMKTKNYVYGVETLNGYDAWALFEACALRDLPKATALLAKDQRLVNAQFWYQFPIHMAVRAGRDETVELLFQATPLAAAVRASSEADPKHAVRTRRMVEFLLKRGAATNLPGDEPWATPLAWAARHRQGEIADLLKQHNAT